MIVTISNEYGSGAVAIAARAAQALGYELIDRQLPVVVAKRLSVTPEEVEAGEDTGRSVGERLLTGLELATPELAAQSAQEPFDEELLRAVQTAIREYAARGNAVIVGRAAGIVLGARPDVVRVFMHAPRDWRVARVVESLGVDERTAGGEIDRVDRARAAHVRDWYGATFGDSRLYDLSIDTRTFGAQSSAALIVAAVRSRA
ncbi:MAG TPA: cytidylate kinase-like family protein [Verrucomicrobiae bacterium]|nr:cytidylate kinase-like family protein [Verrucomicrobiae bacterium]